MSREVLFEMTRLGNCIKVTAIDTETMVEVSIVGPVVASPVYLKRTALRKLQYVLAKRQAAKSVNTVV